MSRTGQKPIAVPPGVTATAAQSRLTVKGPKGELALTLPPTVSVTVDGGQMKVARADDRPQAKADHGTIRSIMANMIEGVTKGYVRALEIEGVGFKASVQGQRVDIALGYPAPVSFTAPDGVKLTVADGTKLTISGCDKQKVGDAAACIRAFFPAEPYKGKGLRYKGEHVRRKVGKTVA